MMRVAAWDAGVVEVEVGAVGHAEFFHDAARGLVAEGGDGDDFGEVEGVEAEVDGGAGAFGGEALAVDGAGEAPADFDGGLREVGDDVAHGLGADDAGEGSGGAEFGGEEAEAVAVVGGLEAGEGGVAFFGGHGGGEVGHDVGVGVHGGEGRTVGLAPGAEDEACGFELERACPSFS